MLKIMRAQRFAAENGYSDRTRRGNVDDKIKSNTHVIIFLCIAGVPSCEL